jgi:hypothetical protein
MPSTVNNPLEINPLTTAGFILNIDKLPGVSYFCQEVNLPGVIIENALLSNPFKRIPQPADQPSFEDLTCSFQVNQDLSNWLAMYWWFVGITFPENYDQFSEGVNTLSRQFKGDQKALYAEISLIILNAHKNPIKTFTYHNCLPTQLSGLELSNTNQDSTPITATASFEFSHFSVLDHV